MKENGSPAPIFDINDPERNHFIVEIPIHTAFSDHVSDQVSDRVSDQVSGQIISIITYCTSPKSKQEILTFLGLKKHTDNFKRHIQPLIEKGFLDYTVKENLKDRNQKYIITDLGKFFKDGSCYHP